MRASAPGSTSNIGPGFDVLGLALGCYVTVELEEQPGLRLTSTVIGSPNDDIVIDAPVELDWIERDGAPLPVFRLVEGVRLVAGGTA